MIIYEGTKEQFSHDVLYGLIADKLERIFKENFISGGCDPEWRSWVNSLRVMESVLDDPAIPADSDVAVEYQIPTTAKRIDFMIAGQDEKGKDNVYIIELKQWEKAERTSLEDCVKTYTGGSDRVVQHPSKQVYNYAALIANTNKTVQEEAINLIPCAFLHNFRERYRGEIENSEFEFYIQRAPLYLLGDAMRLRADIRHSIIRKSDKKLFSVIEYGKLRPSKALQDEIVPLLEGNEVFQMIDEQQIAYSTILRLVSNIMKDKRKYTIVIQGGPGTGKSVIAVTLLAKLLSLGFSAAYVTKNAAPRSVFSAMLVNGHKKQSYVRLLFKGSGSFVDETTDRYDCLLVDEAHRLNDKSGMYRNKGENQIKEIINAAKISVFFLDEDQIVTAKDIGTLAEIRKWAQESGSELIADESLRLTSQFRCNGSNAYIAFLDDLLGIRETANKDLDADLDFDFRVYDDPVKMREDLRKKNEIDNKARMVAGYCYPWRSKKDPSAQDIVLPHGFSAQWNFDSTSTWAIDENSFDQVGCIHTAQGLEFDYVGVIIGQDMFYEDGAVQTDYAKRAGSDSSVHGLSQRADRETLGDRIVRDTYKTLLTRGQKGCYVYCEDPALGEYIAKRIKK